MLGDRKTVVLRGGAPWGFRLAGGGQSPIYIAKVRSRSKAALGGLAAGDNLVSINGLSTLQQSLREVNDIIDTVRDQLIIEVQCTSQGRGIRLDSSSSIDTRENSPARSIHRITPQPISSPITTYPDFSSTPQRDQRFIDSYGRSIPNPLPALFRTAAITTNPSTTRVQPISPRTMPSNHTYDTPRSYNTSVASGYLSDTNEMRRSSISMRPLVSTHRIQQPPTNYNVRVSTSSVEPNYFSDSECVTSGPRYYKISRQINSPRRPSNVVLPIRSVISRAYDPYVPVEPTPPPPPQPIEVFRQQPIARFNPPPKLYMPPRENGFTPRTNINHELGAELLKSPISNKQCYSNSSFFKTASNTYPTIEEQKQMAHQIATILESGDPSQRGSTKFEKQRQRADKYTLENDSIISNPPQTYRPLRPLQSNGSFHPPSFNSYSNSVEVPNCIKHSLDEAQYINPLRYVGAPEEFKQMHMQEHVTHTNVPPQAAMNLVADLNSSQGKGAALFQKRKARSEKWIIDENNVKKQGYQPPLPPPTYPSPLMKPWGQRATPSWSDNEGTSFSPIRPTSNPSPEPVSSPNPRFGDFNAKPKGFASWNSENTRSQSPRGSVDGRKSINLNIEPSIREGIAESHTRLVSQPWSPTSTSYLNYPSENSFTKWQQPPMTHDGIDHLRQRLTQHSQMPYDQSFKSPRLGQMPTFHSYSSSTQNYTDL